MLTLDICRDMIYIVRRHNERRYNAHKQENNKKEGKRQSAIYGAVPFKV